MASSNQNTPNEHLYSMWDALPHGVYISNKDNEIEFVNAVIKEIFGPVNGKKCFDYFHGRESACPWCKNDEVFAGKSVRWEWYSDKNDTYYDLFDMPIKNPDGTISKFEMFIDITKLKRAEKEISMEKERLSVTLRSIGDAVISTDMDGNVVFLNRVAEELTGWKKDDAQGKPSTEIFNIINEKTGLKCASPVSRVLELGRIIGLANHTAIIAKEGTIRSIADSGAPIRDREGKIIGVVIVFRDITNEKKMEEELIKVRKLESVGVLAGGIAHDFNNMLSAIMGNIELAAFHMENNPQVTALLKDAQKGAKRATTLTQQLLTFSKGGEPVKEATSLRELIQDSAEFVLHGSRVYCECNFSDDLWLVNVDSGQISQVIQNITLNAKHSMSDGGKVKISCTNIADAATETLLSMNDDNYVCITIQDTGIGIPKEVLNKVFDPYYTTKQEGSGLGLAICHSIINKHDGYITVKSQPGKGTTMTVYLPAVISGETLEKKEQNVVPAVKSATVLVMDDDEMLRKLLEAQLAQLGHAALLVEDGEQAINKYQQLQDSGTPVDLVIMDLTIPGGMGGLQAAEKLLQIDAQVKIIVSSGYSSDPVVANFKDYGFVAALGKPFDINELRKSIEAVLTD